MNAILFLFKFIIDRSPLFTGILLMVFSSLFLAVGQLVWKIFGVQLFGLFLGLFLYAIGAFSMIIAYRYGNLSVLHPMMSFAYIFAFIFGWQILNEEISILKIFGLFVIIIGIYCLARGDSHD